ncbi:NUDIX domain-containing protein [Planctomycetes bacterium Poly30]
MHTPSFTHAGGVVLRLQPGASPLVLVVRPSSGSRSEWVLPKGHIEPGESAEEAAVREVAEEAGVAASDPHYVGFIRYEASRGHVSCAFYSMNEDGPVPSEEDRPVAWLGLEKLRGLMRYPETLALVERAIELRAPR